MTHYTLHLLGFIYAGKNRYGDGDNGGYGSSSYCYGYGCGYGSFGYPQ